MSTPLQPFFQKLGRLIWLTESSDMPAWKTWIIHTARIIFAIGRDLTQGLLTLRAMSLVYTTLLSLVPLLAVSFSVLKAFGVHNQIEPLLLNLLAPLGPQGLEITTNIIGFVENMKVGILGTLGMALLFYTVVALMQKIESAFNQIWHVTQPRTFAQRFSDYLSVLMIGPVLVISALGMTGTMLNISAVQWLAGFEPFGSLIELVTRLIPYFLIIGVFAFIYMFIPNTKVTFKAAFSGALVAGVLWQTLGWGFASFIVSSTKYTAIYSAFATLMFFLIWLYLGWLVMLIGASIAFYVQNADYLNSPVRNRHLSSQMKDRLAVLIMSRIAKQFYHQQSACTARELASHVHMPMDLVGEVLSALEQQSVIKQSNDKTPVYLPARPLEDLSVKQVLDAVRRAGEDAHFGTSLMPSDPAIEAVFEAIDESIKQSAANQSIKQLVSDQQPAK